MSALSTPLSPTTRLRRADSVVAADLQGELVILDTARGVYLSLDPIGTDIWHRLEASMTLAALTEALAESYDAPAATIERDVCEWLATMAARGLILFD